MLRWKEEVEDSTGFYQILVGTFRGRFELCFVDKRNVAKFLFDIMTDLTLCGGRERVPALSEDLHQII